MIEENVLTQLHMNLKRVFAMPITRSTFREVQNAVMGTCPNNKEEYTTLFESLITGDPSSTCTSCKKKEPMEKLINEFSIPIRVAKDVFERGEFISMVSSDIIAQKDRIAFLNRIRRMDGEEIHFISDIKGSINLLLHFAGRLQEAEKSETGKELLSQFKEDFSKAKEIVDHLASP